MRSRWLLVVDPLGATLAASGGAPQDPAARPPEVAEAARAAAAEVRAGAPAARREAALAAADVEVVALAAIALERSACTLGPLVARALAPLRGQAEARDVLLRVEDDGAGAAPARLDAGKVVWLVATLASNALRFVRPGTRHQPGGTVTVRIARGEGGAGSLALEVADDGPGMDAERVRYLFAQRGDGAPAGGVALAMARSVAAAHGGDLTVESSTDPDAHGTTVRVVLPSGG